MWQKDFGVLFRFTVPIAVQLSNAKAKFHKVVRDIIQVRWKTVTLLYVKSTQDNTYQGLSQSARFCGRHDKNLVCFSVRSVET